MLGRHVRDKVCCIVEIVDVNKEREIELGEFLFYFKEPWDNTTWRPMSKERTWI